MISSFCAATIKKGKYLLSFSLHFLATIRAYVHTIKVLGMTVFSEVKFVSLQ